MGLFQQLPLFTAETAWRKECEKGMEKLQKEITILSGDEDGNNRFLTMEEIIDKSIEV